MNRPDLTGEKNRLHKLKDFQVAGIRKLYKIGGITQARLGEIYGVRQETVWRILANKSRVTLS